MTKKKPYYIAMMIVGVCLLATVAVLLKWQPGIPTSFSRICLGIGAGLSAIAASNLLIKHWEAVDPELMKQNQIEFQDERNSMIRHRAKATASDILQWLIMGIAYVTIFIEAPLWVTLVVVGVFLMKFVLELFFMSKYQKEM